MFSLEPATILHGPLKTDNVHADTCKNDKKQLSLIRIVCSYDVYCGFKLTLYTESIYSSGE